MCAGTVANQNYENIKEVGYKCEYLDEEELYGIIFYYFTCYNNKEFNIFISKFIPQLEKHKIAKLSLQNQIIELVEKSRQLPIVIEATSLPERDVPDYLEGNHSKLSAKFVRTPSLDEIPYAVIMEPNLVVEFYAKN